MKFEIKKEFEKKNNKKTSIKRSDVFQIALEKEEKRILLGELSLFNVFVMLKTTFNKHQLIKFSMTCVFIKPEVKTNNATEITTATNEAWIGSLHKNFYLIGNEWHFW